MGVELAAGSAGAVAAACLAEGLIVNAVTPTALRLEPPLVVTGEEIDEGLAILGRVLDREAR